MKYLLIKIKMKSTYSRHLMMHFHQNSLVIRINKLYQISNTKLDKFFILYNIHILYISYLYIWLKYDCAL